MWRCAVDLNPTEGCPAFSLKSETYMSLQVLVTGRTKWDIFPKEWLFFSSVLFKVTVKPYESYFQRFSHYLRSGSEANLIVMLQRIVTERHNSIHAVFFTHREKFTATKFTLHGMKAMIWRCAGHLWRIVTYYCNMSLPCYITLFFVVVLLKHRFTIRTISFN